MKFTALVVVITGAQLWTVDPEGEWRELTASVAILLVLGLAVVRQVLVQGCWGIDWSSFRLALIAVGIPTLAAVALIVATGFLAGSVQLDRVPLRAIGGLFMWALAQQFVLQTVLLEEGLKRWSDRRAVFASAVIFALLHLPNPFLTVATFLAALLWCSVYSRHPNIVPLALSHSLGSLVVLTCLGRPITGGLRVGLSYLQL